MSWFLHRSIAAKILICFVFVAAIGLARGAVAYRNLAELEASDELTTHSFKVKLVVAALYAATQKQNAEIRGYLLTKDRAFLDKASTTNQAVQSNLQALRSLTVDNPSQQARIATLSGHIDAWRRQAPIVPLGAASATSDTAMQTSVLGAQAMLDRVLGCLDAIAAEEDKLLDIRNATEDGVFRYAHRVNIIMPLMSLAAVLLFAVLLRRVIARPISELTDAMRRIAKGDLETAVPNTFWRNEIGEMGRSVEVFRAGAVETGKLREERQEARVKVKRDSDALRSATADRFEQIVGGVVEALAMSTAQMQTSAESLLDVAQWTSTQVEEVAGSTRQASQTMQAVAGGTESLLDSVGAINQRMAASAEIAKQAVADADRTTASIEGLARSADRIGDIVALINDVARQTNLLALNATIEAARAGDAGRGFAVVATEVKTLASQTATATEDIRAQIAGIQSAAGGTAAAITQISRTIAEMARVTSDLAAIGAAQGEATRDMVRGTQGSAQATAAVSTQLDKVSEGAVTTGAAANKVLATARDLNHQSMVLREEAQKFVASVRIG